MVGSVAVQSDETKVKIGRVEEEDGSSGLHYLLGDFNRFTVFLNFGF